MTKQSPRTSSTPGSESVNKWKIPHYYRRSSAVSSHQSSGSEAANASTPSTPGINVMSSPKKVLIEDPKKGKKRTGYRSGKGKKKSSEMVFVNYTVQDSTSENSATPASIPEQPPAIPTTFINPKKKSSRSRMLKIFGSSKDPPARYIDDGSGVQGDISSNGAMNAAELYAHKSDSSSAKRSYSSFLKYGKFHGSPTNPNRTHPPEGINSVDKEEVVPRSSQTPDLVKPTPGAGFVFKSARKLDIFGGNVDNVTKESVEFPIDPHYSAEERLYVQNINPSNENLPAPYSDGKKVPSETPMTGKKTNDENDASIAFSRMFTRKRANTGGSMSSLISLSYNTPEQQPQQQQSLQSNLSMGIPPLQKNMSATSISSLSYRYPPIRTASPARPRSGTRGSLNYGGTLHSIADSQDGTSNILAGTESFLDSQIGNRNSGIGRHKRKQESISDSYRLYNASAPTAGTFSNNGNNNAVTPSSSSFVTPPPFTSGYTIPSNTSASSTPSIMEYAHANQNACYSNIASSANTLAHQSASNITPSILDRDSSSEVLLEDSDVPTTLDSLPALRGITKTTLQEEEEEKVGEVPGVKAAVQGGQEPEVGTAGTTFVKDKNLPVQCNRDSLDILHGSSTSSSQIGSVLTNSTSSINSNNISGHWPDQSCYMLADAGVGLKDVKTDNFGKMASRTTSKMSTATTAVGRMDSKIMEDASFTEDTEMRDKALQLCVEFDFENPNSFFHEQTRNVASDSTNQCEQNGVTISTPVNEEASAVTSIANCSPGTAATISVEDVVNSNIYLRNFDRATNNNAMAHPNSLPSQSTAHSLGQWKVINNDLDAITDSFYIGDDVNDLPYI